MGRDILLSEELVRTYAPPVGELHKSMRKAHLDEVSLSRSASTGEYRWDVFLSHAFADQELILALYRMLTSNGTKVYIDWIVDERLERSKADATTADLLQQRMRQCRRLLVALSPRVSKSSWIPWEIGYFDGRRQRKDISVLPMTLNKLKPTFGMEFLDLYSKTGVWDYGSVPESKYLLWNYGYPGQFHSWANPG